MDLQYLRRLIKIFDESTAGELIIEEEGTKISLSRKFAENIATPAFTQPTIIAPHLAAAVPPQSPVQQAVANAAVTVPSVSTEEEGLHRIKSPMVGTFYRAPSPDSGPFVEVGDHVSAGSTLCIVEAMKLMNEIESDIAGTIVKILVENSEAVEYNQPMFLIKPD